MMDCHRKHGKSVFPVFYKVLFADVVRQRGNFEEALWKHGKQCSSEEVLEWREALSSVAWIKGWMSHTIANGHEGELVKTMVAKVLSELKTSWIERHPMFIRSVYLCFSEKKRRQTKWQVFLTFRGPDTRRGFAAYLYISLVAAKIKVFSNYDPSLIGTYVGCEIQNAIDHCKISIPILSENYASSHYCLDELAQMVECKRTKGQKILPIFYKVKPSNVRDVSHRFGEDMLLHKELVNGVTYERWERALREVGSSKGWVSEKIANGHEGVLVKRVVKEVLRLLNNPQTRDIH
ncbi:disease resistance protein L6-like [Syzygium oleosum]|uniref:disease resistance protein L6-like n=1 Tax=Syzygium oleosum TaxID=219896 RepID=UPI0024BB0409|nr:disease resistance protein L6-like [Syzygium oleosum]